MLIDSQARRINPHAKLVFDGVTYHGNIRKFPDVMAANGLVDIPEPDRPADFTPETYYVSEQDTAPYVIYTKRPPEQLREIAVAAMPVLTPLQMRKALKTKGWRAAVKNALKNNDDMNDVWEAADGFRRDGIFAEFLATVTGATEADLDAFFNSVVTVDGFGTKPKRT